jgi:hypothetical protein
VSQTTVILLYLAAALAISRFPFFRIYFSLCNTLIEKIFHVLAGVVISKEGTLGKIKLFKDGSGQYTSNVNSKLQRAIIFYFGYTGTVGIAMGLFYLVSIRNYHLILYLFIGLMVISSLLWIRNVFGILWALSFSALLALPLYYSYETVIMHLGIFLSSVVLVQSIMNALKVLVQSVKTEESPDAITKIAKFPAFIFGFIFLGQSLFAAYFIISNVLNLKASMIRFELLEIIQIVEKFVT